MQLLGFGIMLGFYGSVFVLGILAGMVVNVLADRLPVGKGWRTRSRKIRAWATPLALGAIFSLLLAHLLITLPSLALQRLGQADLPLPIVFFIQAWSAATLVGVFIVDLEHRLIFDWALLPLALALLVCAFTLMRAAWPALAIGVALAGGVFLLFYGLGYLIYRQEALGFGDVKLATLVGLIVGWPGVTTALLATAVIGAVVSLLLLGFGAVGRRTFIPFGVFLAAGAIIAMLTTLPVW